MSIDAVELQMIRLRLHEPFRISSGQTHDRHILLVSLHANGITGYGECVAAESPHYSAETIATARWVLEHHLIPAVLGAPADDARAVGRRLEGAARGHPMAKACLEMAAWDLQARATGRSLSALLGGVRDAVPAGVSIGIQDEIAVLLERVETFIDQGYRRIKLKIAPGFDLPVLAAVRARFPDIALTVDANSAYSSADFDHLQALDEFRLQMIEQPLGSDDLLDHAALQARIRTDLCLDESITSAGRCAEAIHLRSARIVNIKPGRVGGHAESIRIHDLCSRAGIPVWCGGMLESGIGRAHNVALASLPNFTLPNDTSASRRYWQRDIVEPPFELAPDGTVQVPRDPGIGVAIDEPFLASVRLSRQRFTRVSAAARGPVLPAER
jgi:o-succinylbenzoate synthase